MREVESPNVIDEARGGIAKDAFGEDECEGTLEGPLEGAREGGSCRIRRNPDAPNPTSGSVTIVDMAVRSCSFLDDPASKEKRMRPFSGCFREFASRLPVLRFFGIERISDGASMLWGGEVDSPSALRVSCRLQSSHARHSRSHKRLDCSFLAARGLTHRRFLTSGWA